MTSPADYIRFVCHACGKRVSAPAEWIGRKTACPKCGISLAVPHCSTREAGDRTVVVVEPIDSEPGFSPPIDAVPVYSTPPNPAGLPPIRVTCSTCGARFSASDDQVGRMVPCPNCRQNVVVPGAAPTVVVYQPPPQQPVHHPPQPVVFIHNQSQEDAYQIEVLRQAGKDRRALLEIVKAPLLAFGVIVGAFCAFLFIAMMIKLLDYIATH